jgi:sRNA-binding regulator protein Hfq
MELYAIQLTSNFQNHLVLKHDITVKPKTSYTKEAIQD